MCICIMKETHCICLSFKKNFEKIAVLTIWNRSVFSEYRYVYSYFSWTFLNKTTLWTHPAVLFLCSILTYMLVPSFQLYLLLSIYSLLREQTIYYVPYDVMIFFCLQKEGQTLRLIFCRQTDYKYFKGVLSLKTNEFVRVFFFMCFFFEFPLIDFVVFKIINCCEFVLA